MPNEKINGTFWSLSKGAQVSMWVIGLLIVILVFLGGRETVKNGVRANTTEIRIQKVKLLEVEEEAVELKEEIKEDVAEIKEDMKEQKIVIDDIHKIIMER